jgi:pimeloyl-ACP methyl ester carboxylesterase
MTLVLATLFAGGCSAPATPDLGGIYDRAAMEHDEQRNPVIVIPGILGSKLTDEASGRLVWGAFSGGYADPETDDGARLVAVPMAEGVPLRDLRDDVRPSGALDSVKLDLLGIPLTLDAYRRILGSLGVGGYRDEQLGMAGAIDYGDDHYTCFQFDYDWRRDNIENARRLHEFIEDKGAYVRAERIKRFGADADGPVKFDIVAHSMGGLVTRYYLRYGTADLRADGSPPPVTWAGAEHVERAILVGTPSAGSAEALVQLVDGADFAFILPKYEAALLATMPAIYQLLPRPRHRFVARDGDRDRPLDVLDASTWEHRGWGLVDPDQAHVLEQLLPDEPDPARRRAVARDHLEKCLARARGFFAALDSPQQTPPGLTLSLIAGDAVPTAAVIGVRDDGRIRVVERGPGDGSVLRSSALMDEREDGQWTRMLRTPVPWDDVTFLFTDHIGLTSDPAFTDNVLYQLLEAPR